MAGAARQPSPQPHLQQVSHSASMMEQRVLPLHWQLVHCTHKLLLIRHTKPGAQVVQLVGAGACGPCRRPMLRRPQLLPHAGARLRRLHAAVGCHAVGGRVMRPVAVQVGVGRVVVRAHALPVGLQ